MQRPVDFGYPYLTARHTPYQTVAATANAIDRSPSDGVIKSGQLLWTRQRLTPHAPVQTVTAFADELGYIVIDPRVLKATDAPFK